MNRIVNLAFTGACVVTPSYSLRSAAKGPIRALMPSAPRARYATDRSTQIDAHFSYATFDYAQLDPEHRNRQADFRYPTANQPSKGVCFFHDETLVPETMPLNEAVTFDESGGEPNEGSTDARWIADWHRFAGSRSPQIADAAVDLPLVCVEVPGGRISSRFVTAPVTKLRFLDSDEEEPAYYAHEVVVSIEYPPDAERFVLRSTSADGGPTNLVFRWGDADVIDIHFGNGALASISSLLDAAIAGHEHRTLTDYEFELLYDIVHCAPDARGARPVPQTCGTEILHVPCVASMI